MSNSTRGTGSFILGGIVLVGFIFLLGWIAKGVFQLLAYLSPIMIIAAIFLRYQVITEYFGWLWSKIRSEPLTGTLYVLLTMFAFPLVSAYLLFKAYAARKLDRFQKNVQEGPKDYYAEYEVIEDHYLDIDSETEGERHYHFSDRE